MVAADERDGFEKLRVVEMHRQSLPCSDLLGRRWVLRLIWELREEPKRFRELQAATNASPTIINARLAELRAAKLVMLDEESGYRLTTSGKELLDLFLPLHAWSEKWAKRLSP